MMSTVWYQLFVKIRPGRGNTKDQARMKRVHDHLVSDGIGIFRNENDIPVQEEDGTWEVRVFDEASLSRARYVLTEHYMLIIDREVPHDDADEENLVE